MKRTKKVITSTVVTQWPPSSNFRDSGSTVASAVGVAIREGLARDENIGAVDVRIRANHTKAIPSLFYGKLRGTNQSVVFDLALVNVGVAVNQDTEDIILNDRRNGRHLLGRDDEFPHCARVAQ